MSRQNDENIEHLSTMFSQLSGWRKRRVRDGRKERRFAEKVCRETDFGLASGIHFEMFGCSLSKRCMGVERWW
jgi:hypothetical protein